MFAKGTKRFHDSFPRLGRGHNITQRTEFLALELYLVGRDLPGRDICLAGHQDDGGRGAGRANVDDPIFQVLKRDAVGQVEDQQETVARVVILPPHGRETLLPANIPDGENDRPATYSSIFDRDLKPKSGEV